MNINNPNIVFNPLISVIQKVVLYETKTVGSSYYAYVFNIFININFFFSACIWWEAITVKVVFVF